MNKTFRDYVPNINELNKVLYDLPAKAFRSKPVKFKKHCKIFTRVTWKTKFCVTRVANTDTQLKAFMACFVENGNTSLR